MTEETKLPELENLITPKMILAEALEKAYECELRIILRDLLNNIAISCISEETKEIAKRPSLIRS